MTGRQYALRGRFTRDINPRPDLPTALADAAPHRSGIEVVTRVDDGPWLPLDTLQTTGAPS